MLFQPWSTLDSIAENLSFLKEITGDGISPVTYCKLLPYAETAIEKQLKTDGRLKGLNGFEDYSFLDPRLDDLFNYSSFLFSDWVDSHNGILNTSRWAKYTNLVLKNFFPENELSLSSERNIKKAISESNLFLINTFNSLLANIDNISPGYLETLKTEVQNKQNNFYEALEKEITRMHNIALNA